MIAKQTKGRGFRGTLNYVLGKEGAELIGGNMLGETPRELAAEFAESRKLRPNLERAVYHSSLSLPAGERLSDEKWATVAEQYVTRMGFEKSQYVVARHTDTGHDHVHIIASRIGLDGRYVSESNDYQRSEGIVRGLERDHGLTRVTPSQEVERRAPTRAEIEMASRGIVSTKLQLQGLIDGAITDKPTMSKFFERMEAAGVGMIPNIANTGHVSGISFVLDDEQMKGSDLGRGYTWSGLQKRGVDYEQGRDGEEISRRREQAEAREPEPEDGEIKAQRLKEGGGLDLGDDEARDRDGYDDGRDPGSDEGDEGDGEDADEGSGERDEPGETGRQGNPGVDAPDDAQAVAVDDDSRDRGGAGRSDRILKVAASLKSGEGAVRRQRAIRDAARENAGKDSAALSRFIWNLFKDEPEDKVPEVETAEDKQKEKDRSIQIDRKNPSRGRGRGDGGDFFGR